METEAGNTFSGRLDRAMKAQGLNPNQLAQRLETSASRVTSWLDGSNLPGAAHVLKMPAILKVDGHWLLTGEGSMQTRRSGDAEVRLEVIRRVLDAPDTSGAMRAGEFVDNLKGDLPPVAPEETAPPVVVAPKGAKRARRNRA